jgi:hypothetical protein
VDFVKLSKYSFEDLDYYLIDDPINKEYFDNDSTEFIKINKGISRTLLK